MPMRRELGVEIETLIGGAVEKSSLFPPKRYRTKGPTLSKEGIREIRRFSAGSGRLLLILSFK